ncbi:hypothetical protein [uncultured Chryseobacterium sp.]|uniref:GH39 family glycosyl hydrolase n=1 Tax=uncultured Chryseobacterium sp. TaxID=259322 RepID=UPI0026003756|nr:hypothetical protein [uncultured Chryseobacterium sp.]
MNSTKIIFIIICSIIYISGTSQSLSTNVTVNLSADNKKKESVVGFLHFNELEPLKNDIAELQPAYWRFGAKLKDNSEKRKDEVGKLLQNNIVPIIVLSDIYDEEHWYKERGGWIRPSDNPERFTVMIKSLYKELGSKVVFDVWNEPNAKEVWGGTREEFFKTFKVAHDALRSSPDGEKALITGPSISKFDVEYLKDFLDYCDKYKIRLDILNWHDLGTKKDAVQLQNDIKAARELLKKYPMLGVKKIYIPEIIGMEEQFNPLTVFSYLYYLEKGNAFGGCKACWDNPYIKGENSCWNNSMDGILSGDRQRRAVWWIYKYYAESLKFRISYEIDNEDLVIILYSDKNKSSVNIVLGNLGSKKNINFNFTNYKLKYKFKNINKINISIFRISDKKQLPEEIRKYSIKTQSLKTIKFSLQDISNEDVYLIKLN